MPAGPNNNGAVNTFLSTRNTGTVGAANGGFTGVTACPEPPAAP